MTDYQVTVWAGCVVLCVYIVVTGTVASCRVECARLIRVAEEETKRKELEQ